MPIPEMRGTTFRTENPATASTAPLPHQPVSGPGWSTHSVGDRQAQAAPRGQPPHNLRGARPDPPHRRGPQELPEVVSASVTLQFEPACPSPLTEWAPGGGLVCLPSADPPFLGNSFIEMNSHATGSTRSTYNAMVFSISSLTITTTHFRVFSSLLKQISTH